MTHVLAGSVSEYWALLKVGLVGVGVGLADRDCLRAELRGAAVWRGANQTNKNMAAATNAVTISSKRFMLVIVACVIP